MLRSLVFLGLLCASAAACAALSPAATHRELRRQNWLEFLSLLKSEQPSPAFLQRIQPRISSEDFQFLKQQIESLKIEKMPKVERVQDFSATISVQNHSVTIGINPDHDRLLLINHHALTFGPNHTPQERWTKILAALPTESASWQWPRAIFPEAHAGVVTKLVKGVGMLAGPAAATSFGLDAMSSVDMFCEDISRKLVSCQKAKAKLNGYLPDWREEKEKADKAIAAWKTSKKKTKSPEKFQLEDQEDYEDVVVDYVMDAYGDVVELSNKLQVKELGLQNRCNKGLTFTKAVKCAEELNESLSTLDFDLNEATLRKKAPTKVEPVKGGPATH